MPSQDEIELLNDMLSQMDDISEEEKSTLVNDYLIADTANRAIALIRIKDRLDQIKGKTNAR